MHPIKQTSRDSLFQIGFGILLYKSVIKFLDWMGRLETVESLWPKVLMFLESSWATLLGFTLIAIAIFRVYRKTVSANDAMPRSSTRDAVYYIAGDEEESPIDGAMRLLKAFSAFREAARSAEVIVYGRKQNSAIFERIPSPFWETSGLNHNTHMHGGQELRTEPLRHLVDTPIYVDLRVDMDDIRRRWPVESSPLWVRLGRQFLPKAIRDYLGKLAS